jgi:hypothetical protein
MHVEDKMRLAIIAEAPLQFAQEFGRMRVARGSRRASKMAAAYSRPRPRRTSAVVRRGRAH